MVAVVLDVVTEFAREGALSKLLYADDFVLMRVTIEGFRNKFLKWKEAFVSKGSKVNLGKIRLTFLPLLCGGITKDGMSESKVDACGVCNF